MKITLRFRRKANNLDKSLLKWAYKTLFGTTFVVFYRYEYSS